MRDPVDTGTVCETCQEPVMDEGSCFVCACGCSFAFAGASWTGEGPILVRPIIVHEGES